MGGTLLMVKSYFCQGQVPKNQRQPSNHQPPFWHLVVLVLGNQAVTQGENNLIRGAPNPPNPPYWRAKVFFEGYDWLTILSPIESNILMKLLTSNIISGILGEQQRVWPKVKCRPPLWPTTTGTPPHPSTRWGRDFQNLLTPGYIVVN